MGTPRLLENVEHNHFGPRVQALDRSLAVSAEAEIGYLLNVFPNHPGGLSVLVRSSQKNRIEKFPKMKYSVTCWLLRAAAFAPDDPKVRTIFGVHLSNSGKSEEALKQLLTAEELGAKDANTMYNIGLLYFAKGDHGKALDYAKAAYSQGFPLPGLRDKLRRAGKWQE